MNAESYSKPQLEVNDTEQRTSIDEFKLNDFELLGYKSGPIIKLDMAV